MLPDWPASPPIVRCGRIWISTVTLLVEIGEPAEDLGRIAETLQAVTKLRGSVKPAPEGSLPADGKLIEDRRQID